ncbi:MAG: DUF4157 domain-containing protein [bacterium]|nr:DUF4157 domain-containing protein [bacterium]
MSLMAALLRMPGDGMMLLNGPAARSVAGICGAAAVTLGNAVLFSANGWLELDRRSEAGLVLLAHELVHVRQYKELGFFRFLLIYVGEYFAGRIRGLAHRQAYLAISLE